MQIGYNRVRYPRAAKQKSSHYGDSDHMTRCCGYLLADGRRCAMLHVGILKEYRETFGIMRSGRKRLKGRSHSLGNDSRRLGCCNHIQ